MHKEKTSNPVDIQHEALNHLNKKIKKYLFYFLFMFVMSAISFGAFIYTQPSYPTLLSVSPLSVSLSVESNAAFNSIFDLMSSVIKFLPVVILPLGIGLAIVRGEILIGMMTVFLCVGFMFVPVAVSNLIGMEPDAANGENKVILTQYIRNGDTSGYLDAVSKHSIRGELIIRNVLEKDIANQDDANNLIDVFSKADAQSVSVGLSETIARESKARGKQSQSLPASATLAAYVIDGVGGTSDYSVINEQTGYAIFEEAKKLPGFDIPNPYTGKIDKQIKMNESMHTLSKLLMAIFMGISIIILSVCIMTTFNMLRVKKVIREDIDLQKSLHL